MLAGEWSHIFFFQAEDGIRDTSVTGVQTCALPILPKAGFIPQDENGGDYRREKNDWDKRDHKFPKNKIGRASCRERV